MAGILIAVMLAGAGPIVDDRLGFTHGSDIIARCESTSPQDGSFCFGFIAGVYESLRAYESWLNIREICTPKGITLADMRDTVVKRITAHPDDRLGQGASVVVQALKERFPCTSPEAPPANALHPPAP